MRRHALLALALVACVVLAVAEFTDLYSIHSITVTLHTGSVGGHHAYALLVLALAGALLAVAAHRSGARTAAAGLLAVGLVALLIVVTVDLPDVHETGHYGRDYQAKAQPEIGARLELVGSILLLFAGGATLLVGGLRASAADR